MKPIEQANERSTWLGVQPQYRSRFVQLWTALMLVSIGMGLTQPLFSVRIVDRGISLQQYGILQSLASLATIFTQVWIGRFSDFLGRRKPLIIGGLLIIVPVLAVFPKAETMLVFGVLLAFYQVAFNAQRSLMTTWVSGWAEEGNMGRMHGTFRIAGSLGWIVATPFLGLLLDRYAFSTTFRLAAGIYLTAALFITFTIREPKQRTTVQDSALSETVDESAAAAADGQFIWPLQLRLLFLAFAIFTLAQGMGFNLNFIFFVQELGVSNQQFGWLSSLQAWLEVPLMLSMGIISDRFDVAKMLAIGMSVGGLRWLLLSLTTKAVWAYGVQLMHAVGVTVTEVLIVAVIARMVPSRHLGTVMGWRTTVRSLAMFLAPTVAGTIGENLGLRCVFRLSAVLALMASLIILQVSRKSKAR